MDTVAIDLSLDDQVTVFLVPDTLKVLEEPTLSDTEELLILTTVMVLDNFMPLTEAYIVAVPGALAVTLPEDETVAIDLLLDDQVMVFLVPDTLKVLVDPTVSVADVLLILITVIILDNFFPFTDAYIVAVPGALAVTLPEDDTVAIDLLLDDQVMAFLVPDTLKVLVEPTVRVAEVLLILITVILPDNFLPLTDA